MLENKAEKRTNALWKKSLYISIFFNDFRQLFINAALQILSEYVQRFCCACCHSRPEKNNFNTMILYSWTNISPK